MIEILAKSYNEIGKNINLKRHTEDVLKCILTLIQRINIKDKEINSLLNSLVGYSALFHDLGKVSPGFQRNEMKNPNYLPEASLPEIELRHNILSLFFINKEKIEEICKNNENLFATFLSSVVFHHWRKDEKDYLLHINS